MHKTLSIAKQAIHRADPTAQFLAIVHDLQTQSISDRCLWSLGSVPLTGWGRWIKGKGKQPNSLRAVVTSMTAKVQNTLPQGAWTTPPHSLAQHQDRQSIASLSSLHTDSRLPQSPGSASRVTLPHHYPTKDGDFCYKHQPHWFLGVSHRQSHEGSHTVCLLRKAPRLEGCPPGKVQRIAGKWRIRGHWPELSGPHLQCSHSTLLGTANVTHDVIADHDGLSAVKYAQKLCQESFIPEFFISFFFFLILT